MLLTILKGITLLWCSYWWITTLNLIYWTLGMIFLRNSGKLTETPSETLKKRVLINYTVFYIINYFIVLLDGQILIDIKEIYTVTRVIPLIFR